MSLVYWDTMLFAYLFEGNAEFRPKVAKIRQQMEKRGDTLCTSVFTVAEVMAGPSRTQQWDQVSKVREFFRSSDLRLLDFKLSTAEVFAEIRGRLGVTSGDAIHLACAAEARVDLFLTNDKRLAKKIVPGIHFVASLDTEIL